VKDWYTYKEIIEIAGITKQTLNNWRKNGTILYKKISNRTFLYQFPKENNIQKDELPKNL
jgi:predicted site-specific integrase-resolvase